MTSITLKKQVTHLVSLMDNLEKQEQELASEWKNVVAYLIDRKECSLRRMASYLGVSPAYLSEIHTGKKMPSPKMIRLFAERLS